MKESPAFATDAKSPWCDGCGHTPVTRVLQETLTSLYDPNDVVLVTDIGCIGMADGLFTCHTVHGLHGRAPALAAGIAMTRTNPALKVVALMGDGGAAIGLQHILECARLNQNLTLIVCNNQTYGMTGGQQSAYTLPGVRTSTSPHGVHETPFDLCRLLEGFGVLRARTAATARELPEHLSQCLRYEGFSLLETLNYCPSYTGKFNPETLTPKAMREFFASHGVELGLWPAATSRTPHCFTSAVKPAAMMPIVSQYTHQVTKPVQILVAGSAGGGVQSAAEIFANGAILSGLHVAFRGEYPVTVGKGFSTAILVLSPEPILSTSQEHGNLALVVSADGFAFTRNDLAKNAVVAVDQTLETPEFASTKVDFRQFGARQAALVALIWALQQYRFYPLAAMSEAIDAVRSSRVRESCRATFEKLVGL